MKKAFEHYSIRCKIHSPVNLVFFTVFVFFILQIYSCRPEDEAPANPCRDKFASNADFTFMEDAWTNYNLENKTNIIPDTVESGTIVHFNCKQTNATYSWSIIGDPKFKRDTKSFDLIFGNAARVKMRLIVSNNPDKLCFPDDDGVDTVIKVITITSTAVYEPLVGTYKGYEVHNPSEIFTVRFTQDTVINGGHISLWFNGIPRSCNVNVLNDVQQGAYRLFGFDDPGTYFCGTQSMRGWGILAADHKTLTVEYSMLDWPNTPQSQRFSQKFIGIKQ